MEKKLKSDPSMTATLPEKHEQLDHYQVKYSRIVMLPYFANITTGSLLWKKDIFIADLAKGCGWQTAGLRWRKSESTVPFGNQLGCKNISHNHTAYYKISTIAVSSQGIQTATSVAYCLSVCNKARQFVRLLIHSVWQDMWYKYLNRIIMFLNRTLYVNMRWVLVSTRGSRKHVKITWHGMIAQSKRSKNCTIPRAAKTTSKTDSSN